LRSIFGNKTYYFDKDKMRIRETISAWLLHRYKILVQDEENFEHKNDFSYTHAKMLGIVVPCLVVFAIFGFWLGYGLSKGGNFGDNQEGEMRRKVLALNTVVDSLVEISEKQNTYLTDLKRVMKADNNALKGDTSRVKNKSKDSLKAIQTDTINTDYISKEDKKLRQEFEGTVNFTKNTNEQERFLKDFMFFPPLKGMVSEIYDSKKQHFGVDVVTKQNEPIKVIAEGTVILASWTEDTGNIIAVQHRANLISIYKHNSALLKKVGDFVKPGEAIAIVGNTGKLSSGSHLHFELWLNGSPINPERFINF
jgi:murein DD-endopeptidase MepM/ murein hydrolase activator NlpD